MALIGVASVMSQTVNTQPKPAATPGGSLDGKTFAQVEKWMEMIREISREPVKN